MYAFPTVLACTCPKKRDEWNAIRRDLGVTDVDAFTMLDNEVTLLEIQSLDPMTVAITKALHAYRKVGYPVLVDDSSYAIEAFGNFPGPLYAYVEKTITNTGLCDLMRTSVNRTVTATVTVAFASPDGESVAVCRGDLVGNMPLTPQGSDTFGYDNIIVPTRNMLTLAQMGPEQKNLISMRRIAISNLFGRRWTTFPASMSCL